MTPPDLILILRSLKRLQDAAGYAAEDVQARIEELEAEQEAERKKDEAYDGPFEGTP